ncbi:hypothetical protein MUB24_22090 [Lederbergia sp. NSJ-179]|nr:hypothetical protein [Lederbergia sp. NSJ-179]MCJ7843515.1 hypothetical protein [Lederbergia sp. NSJ-179]
MSELMVQSLKKDVTAFDYIYIDNGKNSDLNVFTKSFIEEIDKGEVEFVE